MYRGRLIPGENPGLSIGSGHSPLTVDRPSIPSHRTRRIACILVDDFAIAAITRTNPDLLNSPFALVRMPPAGSLLKQSSFAAPKAERVNESARYDSKKSGPLRRTAYQPHSELSHVSPIARAGGLRPGMTVAQARALIPDLIIMSPSSAAERAAADALLDVAESISPVTEEGAPGCVWLDLTGVEHLYRYSIDGKGSGTSGVMQRSGVHRAELNGQTHRRDEDNEAGTCASNDDVENEIAEEIIRRARRIGLEAAAGIGSNKEVAHLAARCGGARIIAAGREREFLDWLPLDLLQLGPNGHGEDVELMLKRLGIRRLGDITRLDSRAFGTRLGRHGVQLARLARGEGSATVIARPRAEVFTEVTEFDYGIENLEPLGFVLHAMLRQLTARLEIRGLAAGDLRLALGLTGRRHDNRHIAVAAATTEARSLLMLLKLHLEKSPPAAAIEAVRLTVEARTRRPAQSDLFLPAAPAPDRLEAAIARIAALCGPERVGTLVAADSYRPEAVRLTRFAPPSTQPVAPSHNVEIVGPCSPQHARTPPDGSGSTPIVLRALRPAEEVEVMCTRNLPEFVRGNHICARVVWSAGPWRRQGEWWATAHSGVDLASPNNGSYQRDYYELALADGAVYRVYCDLINGRWFVDGIYD